MSGRRWNRADSRVRRPTVKLRRIGRERRVPANTRPSPSPATACRRRRWRDHAVRRTRCRPGCRRPARRWRRAASAAQFALRRGRHRCRAGGPRRTVRARQLVCAAARSRWVNQVPARMCQANAACKSPAAFRCSAISAAFSSDDPHCSIAAASRRCNSARSDFSCDS